MQHIEREITEPVLLCNRKGQLNPEAIGFARSPLIQSNLTKNFMRKKKWNEWSIFGEDILFSIAIWHLDYTVICYVYMFHFETQRFFEKQITMPIGRVKMPEHVKENIQFAHSHLTLETIYDQNETILYIQMPDFDNEVLKAELYIYHPPEDETLNVVIPKNRNTFQFTAKHHTLPTTGYVKLGENLFQFKSDYSFTILNYNRGIWPRHTNWNWAMASQRIGHRRIGLNFGGKWTDGTGMTENAIFIDEKMMKIHEDVVFTYNLKALEEPWKIQTKFSTQVQLTFTPFFKRSSSIDKKIFHTNTHQLIGYFDGSILIPNLPPVTIKQMLGCTEQHIAKW